MPQPKKFYKIMVPRLMNRSTVDESVFSREILSSKECGSFLAKTAMGAANKTGKSTCIIYYRVTGNVIRLGDGVKANAQTGNIDKLDQWNCGIRG